MAAKQKASNSLNYYSEAETKPVNIKTNCSFANMEVTVRGNVSGYLIGEQNGQVTGYLYGNVNQGLFLSWKQPLQHVKFYISTTTNTT